MLDFLPAGDYWANLNTKQQSTGIEFQPAMLTAAVAVVDCSVEEQAVDYSAVDACLVVAQELGQV